MAPTMRTREAGGGGGRAAALAELAAALEASTALAFWGWGVTRRMYQPSKLLGEAPGGWGSY
jgi:hypothetical protein